MSPARVVRDSAGYALSQGVARVALLARGLVAARLLGPAGFGGWNALNLVLDYGAYAPLGALEGLDRRLPSPAASGDRAGAEALSRGAWTAAAAGVLVFAAAAALALAWGAAPPALQQGWAAPALILLAAVLQVAVAYHHSVLRAHQRVAAVSRAATVQALLGAVAGLALLPRFGLAGLAAGWVLGQVAALAALRSSGIAVPLRPMSRPPLRALLGPGLPIFGFFALSLLIRSADRLALLHYGAPGVYGLYSLGLLGAGLVLQVPEAAGYVLYPRVAAAAHGEGAARARAELIRAHRSLCALLPAAVGLAVVCAEPLVTAVLPSYRAAVPALQVLMCAALAIAASTLPTYYLLGSGRERTALNAGLAGLAPVFLVVFVTAARWPEPLAVARAAACAYLLVAFLLLGVALPVLAPGARARGALLAATLLPGLWAALLALGLATWRPPGAVPALARAAVFIAAYAPALWLAGRGLGLRALLRDLSAPRLERPADGATP